MSLPLWARIAATSGRDAAPSGPDLTPDAVNWENTSGGETIVTNSQQITGISEAIALKFEFIGSGPFSVSVTDTSGYNAGASTALTVSGQEVVVAPGKWVTFRLGDDIGPAARNVTVKNASDGDAILDTFTMFIE